MEFTITWDGICHVAGITLLVMVGGAIFCRLIGLGND